ncbi:hypothetical protein ACFLRX_00605 [Acidobacteriota bacterium]
MIDFKFITDDWKKIPQNIRYYFIAGAALVFISWLIDHWGTMHIYKFWGLDIRKIGFSLGLTLIFLGLISLVVKQIIIFKNIVKYRRKYPINKIDTKFYLAWFRGKLILFDEDKKEYHHIYPFETAQDLLFAGTGIYVDSDFENSTNVPIPNSESINPKDYVDGGAINTRK